MYMQQDYLMRQIIIMSRYIASLFLGEKNLKYELPDKDHYTDSDRLYIELNDLLRERKFCAAEDLLFKRIRKNNMDDLKIALDFYDKLNQFSDDVLEENNFPRGEILSGVRDIAAFFGADGI